jgi:hypothetical protein
MHVMTSYERYCCEYNNSGMILDIKVVHYRILQYVVMEIVWNNYGSRNACKKATNSKTTVFQIMQTWCRMSWTQYSEVKVEKEEARTWVSSDLQK